MLRRLATTLGFLLVLLISASVLMALFSEPHRNLPKQGCKMDLEMIQTAIEAYRSEYGDYPLGTNAQVLLRLTTYNPRRITFLTYRISHNPNEYIDPWGQLYRIEVSKAKIKIQSAGPNKTWDDADDLIFEKKIN